jgi:Uma2 family endonuclease
MALEKQKVYTVEEFERFVALPKNDERHFELIDGDIVEKPMPTQEHGRVISLFMKHFFRYFDRNPIGHPDPEVRYRMPGDKRNARQPDLSIVLDVTTPIVKKGAVPRMPDVVVEVKSPDDSITKLRAKAAYYIANGTRLVLLVYPEQRIIEVYRPDADVQILTERDTLDGGDVLPGFSLAVKDVFPA